MATTQPIDHFQHFVTTPDLSAPSLAARYHPGLTVLSVATAILAAFVAFAVVDRVLLSRSRTGANVWLLVGGIAMGIGIWAMHFIAMLAFSLPVAVSYDFAITLGSVFPVIAASTIALLVMSRESIEGWRLHLGGLLMAAGIGTMHYLGMEAMRLDARMAYRPTFFVLSIVVAYFLATTAIYCRFALRRSRAGTRFAHGAGAVVMGLAVAGMHYTAMAAAVFYPSTGITLGHDTAPFALAGLVAAAVATLLVIMLIGTLVDRRLAAAASSVEETANLHSAVLLSIADGVLTFDGSGAVRSFNPSCERMFGWSNDEIGGLTATTLFPAIGLSPGPGGAIAGFGFGQIREIEARRRNGSTFPAEITISDVAVGGRRLFSAVVRDIAKRHAAKAFAARYLADVEESKQLLAAQAVELAAAKDRAEAAAAAKGEFLTAMGHEIRTPMNGVLEMAQRLLDGPLNDEQADQMRSLYSSGLGLLTIINDVLDFSKLEAGKLQIERVAFDLETAVMEACGLLAPSAEEKHVELVMRFAPEVPQYLMGDPGRIRQVLENLGSNAIKFTERGRVVVAIESRDEGDEASIRATVEDTGIGISPATVAKLFTPFSPGAVSTARREGSPGLGLAISKRLVELMGGQIGVRSTPGTGSAFWFTLRLSKAVEPVAPALLLAELPGVR